MLDQFFEDSPVIQTVPEKIKQRRSQMLIHSCIYYELDDNIVSDHKWQEWAFELAELQKKHPEHTNIGFYDQYFIDWDGSTGCHLPHRDSWVYNKALRLLRMERGQLWH